MTITTQICKELLTFLNSNIKSGFVTVRKSKNDEIIVELSPMLIINSLLLPSSFQGFQVKVQQNKQLAHAGVR